MERGVGGTKHPKAKQQINLSVKGFAKLTVWLSPAITLCF